MDCLFHIHYLLRKGLGPDWVEKVEDIFLDDMEEDTTPSEAEAIAVAQFKENRRRQNIERYENNYRITEIISE
ncbi:MAG: hypothetical protein IPJ00_17365 [Saprospirales bacterium]|nr:hypothetical protein [Saprospirales bacterium]